MKRRVVLGIALALVALMVLWLRWETPAPTPPDGDAITALDQSAAAVGEPPPKPREPQRGRAPALPSPVLPAAALQGRIITDVGAPARGIWVSAYQANAGSTYTLTDGSGQFVFTELPDGRFRLSARASGYNDAVLNDVPRGASDIQLVLLPLSEVRGRVVAVESGSPIREFDLIVIDILPIDPQWWQQAARADDDDWEPVTDAAGRFVLGVSSGRAVAVGARSAGFAPAFIEVGPLAPGGLAPPITLALDGAATIAGRVVDRLHQPIVGASVRFGDSERGPVEDITDAEGRFRVTDLADEPVVLTATHPDFITKTLEALPTDPPADIQIVLARGAAVEGRVSVAGDPVADARVVVGALGRDGFQKSARTDDAGAFSIAGLPAGEAEVFVDPTLADEPDTSLGRLQQRVLLEDEIVTPVEFRFPALTSTLEGFVRIGGRAPISATLRGTIVGDGGDAFFSTESRGDGAFRAEGLLPGDAWIEVVATTATGTERRRLIELAIPEGALLRHDVDLTGDGLVTGRVTGLEEGESGEVVVLPAGTVATPTDLESLAALRELYSASAPIQEDGQFRAEGLEPGDYVLLAVVFRPDATEGVDVLSTLRVATTPVVITADKPARATLELAP